MNSVNEPFKKFIGGRLRAISNRVSSAFARKVERSGVTVAEWVILRMVYECGPTVSPCDIARHTGLTRGAVSKLVERAMEKGLVVRTESKSDRRYQDVSLTARARELVPELAAFAQETDEEFFSCLTASERATLVRILQKLAVENRVTEVPIR